MIHAAPSLPSTAARLLALVFSIHRWRAIQKAFTNLCDAAPCHHKRSTKRLVPQCSAVRFSELCPCISTTKGVSSNARYAARSRARSESCLRTHGAAPRSRLARRAAG
eukprot:TRINITY_DN32026_c0_g1_i1.p3 TRINITY_DN32026_c0_g1~~TRINITY_DN32026_c0_g1_i1.p3  ORF type:complete len:108 (+),score=13.93 TRINITY_DN32026_c0_g1_i1:221-544(+)